MKRPPGVVPAVLLVLVPAAALAQVEALKLATVQQPAAVRTVPVPEQPTAVAYTADGGSVVVLHLAKYSVIDMKTGKVTETPLPTKSHTFALSPDATTLAVAASAAAGGYEVQLFTIGQKQPRSRTPLKEAARSGQPLAFSADGSRLAVVENQTVSLIDVPTGKSLGAFAGRYLEAGLSPDGKLALLKESERGQEGQWALADVATGKTRATLASVGRPAFRPDGKQVVTIEQPKAKAEPKVNPKVPPKLVPPKDAKPPAPPRHEFEFTLTFRDLTGQAKRVVRLADDPHGGPTLVGQGLYSPQATFSPDGQILMVQLRNPTRGGLVMVEVDSGRPLSFVRNQQLDQRVYNFDSLAFSPDSQSVTTATYRPAARVGGMVDPTAKPIPIGGGLARPVIVGGDIVGGNGVIHVWNLNDLRDPPVPEVKKK